MVAGTSPSERTTMWAVMIERTPASIAARNGTSAAPSSVSTTGSARCESSGGVAMAGEVLRAGRDAGALQPADERRDMASHELGVRAERADPDHRVLRIRVDVRDRREVEVDADVGELGARSTPRRARVSSASSTTPSAPFPG